MVLKMNCVLNKTLLAITSAGILLGCQVQPEAEHAQADRVSLVSHRSAEVYQLELNAAVNFHQHARALNHAMVGVCQTGQNGISLKGQWQQTMQAWMALQGQERGPQAALEQSWNVQFWPDKKNTTGRKMKGLVTLEKNWSAEEITMQSVTVQGLGSMEWLLYDPASDFNTSPTTCQLGVAISDNLANNAEAIMAAWQVNPWLELDQHAWNTEYIALLSNQLDYSMKKLSRPLAKIGKPRAYFAESWRSQTSMANVKQNVIALKALYFANGDGLDHILRQRGLDGLADRIVNQFDMTLDTWPENSSLFTLLQTKAGYQLVMAQLNKLEHLNYLIHEEVAIELGVVIGFNATDGD
ncbi:iron-regulated protein A [Vibrio renipiscarius]|uniref:Iron-regulated protein A n=2 Tax=Vibrio renipiscarius TaxID=1461322 RepID=A0A0C2NZ99_9VIBR|nr:imelysin family protein [Vibrio renipiscarius]KII79492.1 iron-regulated protein A [Vibrio renipiscarius]KII80879.1 iron-regulated protein A [Vibrio renipiscarius]